MDTVALDQPEWAHQRLIWRISLTTIHVLAILTSIYRISRRYKTRQLGFDDYAATLALFLDLIFFPTLWLRNADAAREVPTASMSTVASSGGLTGDSLPADIETRMAQVAIGWLVQVVYPLLIWTAKASLALTIARLIPPFHCTHKASIVIACLSALVGLGIVVQTCVFCAEVDKTWTHVPPYRCKVTALAGIIQVGAAVIIDIFLVLIPFCAFWPISFSVASDSPPNHYNSSPSPALRLRLPPTTRRLIQVCFTASLLTTSATIVTVALLFKTQNSKSLEIQARVGYMGFLLTHLNVSMSLLACNLLIVVTSLYRLLRTSPSVVEVGKSPVIPHLVDSASEPTGGSSNDALGTGARERERAEGNVSENFITGSGTGGHPVAAIPTTSASASDRIELTELFESDFSITKF